MVWSGLFRKRRGNPPLDAEGRLVSDLWLDQPDAARRIDKRLRRGAITAEQAERLSHFAERGYLVLELDRPGPDAAAIDACVERLWRERPPDVAFAYRGPLRRLSEADPERDRQPSVRISDLHAACPDALELYLHAQLFEYVELIFGQPAVAIQSLYFEYGSQQALHRDPVHVTTRPPSHLLASWIALEDTHPGSGELVYVPGSHRLPYYEIEPGEYRFVHGRHGDEQALAAQQFDLAQCADRGLAPESFLARRGEALIWHASLLHGGAPPRQPPPTRKSLVVHYSTAANHRRVNRRLLEPGEGGEGRTRIFETETLLTAGSRRGFQSPLRADLPTP